VTTSFTELSTSLEAKFRNLVQGDMDITQYTGRLKKLADALRDVGQPVRETSRVLNMLRGLSSKYRHAIPAITSKQPPHTFLSARSYLLLEEHYDKEHDKSTAHQALLATGGSRPHAPATADGGSGSNSGAVTTAQKPAASSTNNTSSSRNDNHRGGGRGGASHGDSGAPCPQMGWAPGHNP
jgi:hypothetical protein